ncbi:CHAT domain-containing protein [Aquimarina amphilecti]|uniref:CHAT domain-containing protein n=1 Tax=Aquimarina amphilecti TaxID=1038014 RepID=A0A1H7L1Q4_AQUAM|nr:CHAT domain-containing tetratricopeptide repeat protein [Aquimarina amphilecti]SEK92197.1 CHAT domain-containing protein [Aquimarina amphilecti]
MERLEYLFDIKILCFFILLIPFNRIIAQSAQDSILAAQYLRKAESLLAEKKLDRSVIYFKKALDVELKIYGQNHERTIIYYDRIGLIYKNLGQHEIALDYFKTFLNLSIKRYGRYHFYAGSGFLNIGVTYKNLFRYDLALENYQKSLMTYEYLRKKDMTAFIYDNIGEVFTKNGENTKAIEYYNKSIKIGTKLFGENYIKNAKSYQNIGILYNDKKEYEKSLSYYQKSIKIHINAYGENNLTVAQLYSDIGDIYRNKEEYDLALDYYQNSLKSYTSVLDKNDPKIVNLNLQIASIYIRKKKYDEALKYYETGLSTFQRTLGENHLRTSDFYYNIAKVYDRKKDFNKAISFYDKAVIANRKINHTSIGRGLFDPSEYYDLKLLLTVLHGKAKTLQSKYIENEDLGDLCISLKIYEEVDILIDYIRKSYQNYQDKIIFASSAREVYGDAIEAQFLFHKEVQEQQTIEKIIYYIEKSKANALKDLINESKTKEFAGLSKELLELEKSQRINRAFYQSRIIEERSKSTVNNSRVQEYENKLSRLKKTEDSLTTIIKNNYPKYHKLKYKNTIVLVDDIQKMLKDKSSLLEFFVSDQTIYAFIITKNRIEVKELKIPKLNEKIQEFRLAITDKNTITYKTIAHQLYQDLIAPLKDFFTGSELVIVPDGALWHLNFDLLLTRKDNTNNPKELSYLLKEYIVSYANSANLLVGSDEKSAFDFTQMQKECLAFSFSNNIDQQNSNTISLSALTEYENDLPGTRKEIKSIAKIIDGNYFYGLEAVEKNFKKNVSEYNILHLALHGEVDNERPENSKLFFTQSNDSIEDDLLHSHELFALNIPAELTVLSACNTGTGKIAKGEGIMSLGTAFQYAGAKSLLLSSWDVSDQTTPDLMKYFYTNLKEGMSKGEALQQAKLQYLNRANINRIHPFYWGGFYLIGDTTPIKFNNYYAWYWSIIGVSILAIFALIFLWYKKRKST